MVYTSTLQIVYEDEALRIGIQPTFHLLQLTWQRHPTSEEYRHGYEQAMQTALDNKIMYWLTDSRKVAYLHMADQHWMYARMLPLLKSGQLLKFAVVLQPETFLMTDRKPVQHYLEEHAESGNALNLDFFLDLEAAQCWLQETH